MYRSRVWTMRQYAGFGSAAESNQRYRYLLEHGVSGLSVAFDLPTQMGYDSDHPLAAGEVGKVGVAIDSIEDMAALFDGIPLDRVSTSMTINATAIILLVALYRASRAGRASRTGLAALSGTVQNDILKEYVARGTYIFPPRAVPPHRHRHRRVLRTRAARVELDLDQRLSHPRSGIDGRAGSGVHVRACDRVRAGGDRRRAGRQPVRAAALVLLQRPQQLPRGDRQVSSRAAVVGDDHARSVPATNPRAQQLRFHTQTAGSTLTAQQPDNNIVRVALQALAAVLGGTQSLHCNGRDEALALPTEEAAGVALRTQQIIAAESGVDEHGRSRRRLVRDRDDDQRDRTRRRRSARANRAAGRNAGGDRSRVHPARNPGIGVPDAAGHRLGRIRRRRRQQVRGLTARAACRSFRAMRQAERSQIERLQAVRAGRSASAWRAALDGVSRTAADGSNLVPAILAAVEARATVGEISDAMRAVFGTIRRRPRCERAGTVFRAEGNR